LSLLGIRHPIPHPASRQTIWEHSPSPAHGLDEVVRKFKADHDDYNAIMAEALRTGCRGLCGVPAQARPGRMGYGKSETLTREELIDDHTAAFAGAVTGMPRSH